MLSVLGQLWEEGFKPDWKRFYQEQNRQKITLPPYVYNCKKCWVDPVKNILLTDSIMNIVPVQKVEPEKFNKLNLNKLTDQIKSVLHDASGIDLHLMQPGTSFIEMGFDSLLLTQISISLSKKFNVPVSFRSLNEQLDTLETLTEYLQNKLPKEAFAEEITEPVTSVFATNPVPDNSVLGLLAQQVQLISQQINLMQGQEKTGIKEASVQTEKQPAAIQLSAEELAEIIKPFGATARIQREKDELSSSQQNLLKNLISNYNQKTAKSKAYTQENRSFMADPRVVSGFTPATKEIIYPLVVNRSQGSCLWDIDGNKYIDALNGFGSNFLGYQPEFIKKALHEQIESGYEIGPQHSLAGEVILQNCLDRYA